MEQALTARPLRLMRRRKRVLAQVADPGVVLGAVVAVVVAAAVAAATIAGSLSLNRKMILRVPKKLATRMRRSPTCLASSWHESVANLRKWKEGSSS
jgi:hypothetical protein